ncbi:MAG: hypothetical protein H7Z38_20555, partial [Rubrivivax sp.]|nr:hypothetical protein [Pyrinomonadaceae bacterium]
WNIDIRSEEEIKKEVAAQMGAMIASGEPVPLERLQGLYPTMTAALAERGIADIESLAAASVDDLAEFLDISLDQAESIVGSAQAVITAALPSEEEGAEASEVAEAVAESDAGEATAEAQADTDAKVGTEGEEVEEAYTTEATEEEAAVTEIVEQHAASVELDPNAEAREVEPSNAMTDEGYDEAAHTRTGFLAEESILAGESADPVVVTEAEQMSADELLLQGAGRDLRPDTITPAPDISSAEAAVIQNTGAFVEEEGRGTLDDETSGIGEPTVREDEGGEDSTFSPRADFASEASAPETQVSSEPSPVGEAETTIDTDVADNEAEDASRNVE